MFHLALAQNQVRAYRAGRYPAGFAVGGTLWLAKVRREGVSCRTMGEL